MAKNVQNKAVGLASSVINVQVDTPFCTPREFARRSGMSERTIRDKAGTGILPTRPREGDKSSILINMVALVLEAAELHETDKAER